MLPWHSESWPEDCSQVHALAAAVPYHLADYACRVLRVTPFRYYIDLLFLVMREEKSYDQIPNFTVGRSLFVTRIRCTGVFMLDFQCHTYTQTLSGHLQEYSQIGHLEGSQRTQAKQTRSTSLLSGWRWRCRRQTSCGLWASGATSTSRP